MSTRTPDDDRVPTLDDLDLDDDELDDDPLAVRADLGALRLALHHALDSGQRTRIDDVLRTTHRALRDDAALTDDDRARLELGLAREAMARLGTLGASPPARPDWSAFVAGLSPTRTRAALDLLQLVREPRTASAADAPPPVHWNTRILDGDRAVTDDELIAGRTYELRTKLDPAAADDALFPFELDDVVLADGTPVTFVVECKEPVLRAAGTDAWGQRVERTEPYELATGETAAAVVELRATAAGALSLAFSLLVGNVTRASARGRLRVTTAPTSGAPAPATPTTPAARQVALSAAALRGHADLHLDLTPAGELQLRAGAVVGSPCPLVKSPSDLATITRLARNDLVALTHAYQPAPGGAPFALADGAGTIATMARIGARLHAAFFGLPGQRIDGNLRELCTRLARTRDARLQIAAAFQPFPWAVFYDGAWLDPPIPPERAPEDPSGFWGKRFRIDRAIVGHVPEVPRLELPAPLRVQPVINPHLDQRRATGDIVVVAPQRALFAPFTTAATAAPPIESDAALAAYLAQQPAPCDLLYFFCHATSASSIDELFNYTQAPADDQASLVLDANGGTTVATMATLRQAALADHPLVFLNACGSVAGDQAFAPPLLAQFLDQWGAAGVLGTDWEVNSVFADAFARRLVERFVGDRLPLGRALASVRDEAFAQGNPFALVYALYAPPDLSVAAAP